MTFFVKFTQSSNVVSELQLLFFYSSKTCYYMDNIQQFMMSELDDYFNMLTNFLYLAMCKQVKQPK